MGMGSRRPAASDRTEPGGKTVRSIECFTEVPMLVLAVVYIPVFIIDYLPDVSASTRREADVVQWAVVAAFATELMIKVAVADQKVR